MVMGTVIKVVLAALLVSGIEDVGTRQPHHILLPVDVVQELNGIADTATIEHLRCVLGKDVGDTTFADSIIEPKTWDASEIHITGFCPKHTVVDWHNHLPYWFTITGEKRGPVEPRSLACVPSHADEITWLYGYPNWAMISVDSSTWCLFVRIQGNKKVPPRIMRIGEITYPDGTTVKP